MSKKPVSSAAQGFRAGAPVVLAKPQQVQTSAGLSTPTATTPLQTTSSPATYSTSVTPTKGDGLPVDSGATKKVGFELLDIDALLPPPKEKSNIPGLGELIGDGRFNGEQSSRLLQQCGDLPTVTVSVAGVSKGRVRLAEDIVAAVSAPIGRTTLASSNARDLSGVISAAAQPVHLFHACGSVLCLVLDTGGSPAGNSRHSMQQTVCSHLWANTDALCWLLRARDLQSIVEAMAIESSATAASPAVAAPAALDRLPKKLRETISSSAWNNNRELKHLVLVCEVDEGVDEDRLFGKLRMKAGGEGQLLEILRAVFGSNTYVVMTSATIREDQLQCVERVLRFAVRPCVYSRQLFTLRQRLSSWREFVEDLQ
jgi:hypothetical protein